MSGDGLMEEEPSKYPIADMGDDFQPDAMGDFDARVNSGEFANLTEEQIREVYVREEEEAVNNAEYEENCRQIEEREEREQRERDGDDD